MKKPLLLFILSSFLFNTLLTAQIDLQNGLLAYYPFSGNANDASGNSYNGTVNSATLTTDRFGNLNSAYSFNGTSSYISIGNNTNLKRFNSDYSISTWVNINGFSSGSLSEIVSNRGNAGEGSGMALLGAGYGADSNKLGSIVNGGGATSLVKSTNALISGQWYMLTITFKYNGSNNNDAKIYINGVLNTSGILANVTDPGSLATYIGFDPSPTAPVSYHFNGKIDEVRIYQCELTAQQITDLYNDVTGILKKNISTIDIKLYPNPTNDIISLETENNIQMLNISMINQIGQEVYKENLNSSTYMLNITSFENGFYTLIIQTTKGVIHKKVSLF